jgi:hypothetical protein
MAALAAIAVPLVSRAGGVSGGMPFNVVRLDGILGTRNAPHATGELAELTLDVNTQKVAFAVIDVRRVNGAGEGRGLLNGLGPGVAPIVRVTGSADLIARLMALQPGARVSLVGQLSVGERLYRILSVDPAPDPA